MAPIIIYGSKLCYLPGIGGHLRWAEDYKGVAEHCKVVAKDYKVAAEDCKVVAKDCKVAAEDCKVVAKDCKVVAEHYKVVGYCLRWPLE